jgi:hypothetical protein
MLAWHAELGVVLFNNLANGKGVLIELSCMNQDKLELRGLGL